MRVSPEKSSLPSKGQRHKRFLATAALFAAGVATVATGATYLLFVSPGAATTARADAVIVLAGGEGERLPKAIELMASGIADTLVVSTGNDFWTPEPAFRAIRDVCARPPSAFRVICKQARPDSTRGEGSEFSRLANDRGWTRLVIVTSDYHQTRSLMWFRRCFGGAVFGIPASSRKTARLIFHEVIGTMAQATIQRSCTTVGA